MRRILFLLMIYSGLVSAEPLKLALNWKAEPQFGGFFAAQQLGAFKAAHLDINLLEGGSGTPTVQMLASGKVEYAIVSADEIILARDRGSADLVALFASYQTNPQCIMVHAERNYKSLSELFNDETALLLWQSGLAYAQFLRRRASAWAVKTAPFTGGIAALQHDPAVAQQCFIAAEPVAAKHAGISIKVFRVADEGYNPYTTVLATKRSRLEAHPDEVRAMVGAVREGWQRYLKNPDETNQYMQTINRFMDKDTFRSSALAQKELVANPAGPLGQMTDARWASLVRQLKDLGLIKVESKAVDLFKNL